MKRQKPKYLQQYEAYLDGIPDGDLRYETLHVDDRFIQGETGDDGVVRWVCDVCKPEDVPDDNLQQFVVRYRHILGKPHRKALRAAVVPSKRFVPPAAAVSPPVPQAPAEVRADRAAAVRTKIMENLYCPLCKYPDHTRNTKVVASALGGSHGHLPGRTHADHLKIFLDEWERDEASPAGWVAKPPHYWVPPIDLWPLYEPEVEIPDVADLDVWKKIRANFGKRKKRPRAAAAAADVDVGSGDEEEEEDDASVMSDVSGGTQQETEADALRHAREFSAPGLRPRRKRVDYAEAELPYDVSGGGGGDESGDESDAPEPSVKTVAKKSVARPLPRALSPIDEELDLGDLALDPQEAVAHAEGKEPEPEPTQPPPATQTRPPQGGWEVWPAGPWPPELEHDIFTLRAAPPAPEPPDDPYIPPAQAGVVPRQNYLMPFVIGRFLLTWAANTAQRT